MNLTALIKRSQEKSNANKTKTTVVNIWAEQITLGDTEDYEQIAYLYSIKYVANLQRKQMLNVNQTKDITLAKKKTFTYKQNASCKDDKN